jgi:hypothetical protein
MKLADLRQAYYDASAKTSELVRQMGFAGIALVWIFKSGTDTDPKLRNDFLYPAIFIVISLAFDLSQYIVASAAWGIYNRIKELQGVVEEEEFLAPSWINWAADLLFAGKIICMAAAYIFLIKFLWTRFV